MMKAARIANSANQRPSTDGRRIGYLDALKGIGIFLIVLGHVTRYEPLIEFLYSFHVPVFFIISGAFFKSRPFADFVRRRLKALLIPYLVFATLSTLYWLVIERRFRDDFTSPLSVVANVFFMSGGSEAYSQNAALWFLPALFVAEIIFYWMHTATVHCPKVRFALPAVTYLFGMAIAGTMNYVGTRLPFMLDVALLAAAWYSLGFCLKPLLLDSLPQKRGQISRIAWLFACCVIGVVLWLLVGLTDVAVNYGDYVFSSSIMPAVTGMLGFCFALFMSLALEGRAICWLGRRSLGVMCIHEPIKRVAIKLAETVTGLSSELLRDRVLVSLVLSVVTVVFACAATIAIEHFAPWTLGGGSSPRSSQRTRRSK